MLSQLRTFSGGLAAILLLVAAGPSVAGGSFPLPCSQGDEIRTIDHYMDVNMEDLQRINNEEMPEDDRQLLIAENTEEFMALQARRDELSRDCAREIHTRDVYWEEQGLDKEAPPEAEISLDPPSEAASNAPADASEATEEQENQGDSGETTSGQ